MYSHYKPLRNFLRGFPLMESLAVAHAYFQFMQFDAPLPKPLGHPRMQLLKGRPGYGVGMFEWELEILVREIILNCPDAGIKSLKNWPDFACAMNHVKRIENDTWGISGENHSIWREIHRIAHRQFNWQRRINHGRILRYFTIFNHPKMSPLVLRSIGLPTEQIFSVGMSLTGHFLKSISIQEPLRDEVYGLSAEVIAGALSPFVISMNDVRDETKSAQQYNVNWAYTFNPLRKTPLVRISTNGISRLFCPIPRLLLERITDGIFYEVAGDADFASAFGLAFQDYVGSVLERANRTGGYSVVSEHFYGSKGKRKATSDWIVDDEGGTLFVECKTKRMKIEAKFDLNSEEFFTNEIENMAGFLVQLYKTIVDALSGAYSGWKPHGGKIYPVVVTLENWYAFGNYFLDKVDERLGKLLSDVGVDASIVGQHPYTICAVEDLEMAIQVIDQRGIEPVFDEKIDGEKRYWDLSVAVEGVFPKEAQATTSLFPEQWKAIHPVLGA